MPKQPPPDWVVSERRAIGDNIRHLMLAANLTQEKLGLMTGIDRASINRIQMGHQAASIDTLILIASALAVPVEQLVRTTPRPASDGGRGQAGN